MVDQDEILCACGCGERVKTPGSKFVRGHHRRKIAHQTSAKKQEGGEVVVTQPGTFTADARERLLKHWQERIKTTNPNELKRLSEAFEEYYNYLASRGVEDPEEWMHEAINVLSKKDADKQHTSYWVGIVRQWAMHGKGFMPSEEEDRITKHIEAHLGSTLSAESRQELRRMITRYGVVSVLIEANNVLDNLNPERILIEMMKERFGRQ